VSPGDKILPDVFKLGVSIQPSRSLPDLYGWWMDGHKSQHRTRDRAINRVPYTKAANMDDLGLPYRSGPIWLCHYTRGWSYIPIFRNVRVLVNILSRGTSKRYPSPAKICGMPRVFQPYNVSPPIFQCAFTALQITQALRN